MTRSAADDRTATTGSASYERRFLRAAVDAAIVTAASYIGPDIPSEADQLLAHTSLPLSASAIIAIDDA